MPCFRQGYFGGRRRAEVPIIFLWAQGVFWTKQAKKVDKWAARIRNLMQRHTLQFQATNLALNDHIT